MNRRREEREEVVCACPYAGGRFGQPLCSDPVECGTCVAYRRVHPRGGFVCVSCLSSVPLAQRTGVYHSGYCDRCGWPSSVLCGVVGEVAPLDRRR